MERTEVPNEVHTLYGFRFRGGECIEGEKYVICGEELFYKRPLSLNLGLHTESKPKFPLRLYNEANGERCLGYCITRNVSRGCASLASYHKRMRCFEKDKSEVDELFQDIIRDCELEAEEIGFVSVIPSNIK